MTKPVFFQKFGNPNVMGWTIESVSFVRVRVKGRKRPNLPVYLPGTDFILGGFETVAQAKNFCTLLLAKDPEKRAKFLAALQAKISEESRLVTITMEGRSIALLLMNSPQYHEAKAALKAGGSILKNPVDCCAL